MKYASFDLFCLLYPLSSLLSPLSSSLFSLPSPLYPLSSLLSPLPSLLSPLSSLLLPLTAPLSSHLSSSPLLFTSPLHLSSSPLLSSLLSPLSSLYHTICCPILSFLPSVRHNRWGKVTSNLQISNMYSRRLSLLLCLMMSFCLLATRGSGHLDSFHLSSRSSKKGTDDASYISTLHAHKSLTVVQAKSSHSAIASQKNLVRRKTILGVLLPWFYFISTSLQIPSMPKYINSVVNKGDLTVSPASAKVYGSLQGVDALFTFLSVNAIGVLSDRFGRKPFMIYSSIG